MSINKTALCSHFATPFVVYSLRWKFIEENQQNLLALAIQHLIGQKLCT